MCGRLCQRALDSLQVLWHELVDPLDEAVHLPLGVSVFMREMVAVDVMTTSRSELELSLELSSRVTENPRITDRRVGLTMSRSCRQALSLESHRDSWTMASMATTYTSIAEIIDLFGPLSPSWLTCEHQVSVRPCDEGRNLCAAVTSGIGDGPAKACI